MPEPERPLRAGDFDYDYPPDAVAQHPLEDRAASRLLVLDRADGRVTHRRFRDFPDLLRPADLLVVNVSRVMPARVRGTRAGGGAAEVLLLHPEPDGSWVAMVHPGSKLKPGRRVAVGPDAAIAIAAVEADGLRRVRVEGPLDAHALMVRYGEVPLPPYIARAPVAEDRERYQTVYASVTGSVAAPTAGLHFTPDLLAAVRARGARIVETLLHVGPGTFRPVEVADPAEHRMHAEWYEVPADTRDAIAETRAAGGRVWAVGTTVTRTLESAGRDGRVAAGSGWTDLFIYPPFRFAAVDAMLTNFHLPRSTLLLLVAAFAGYEATMAAYQEAVAEGYRLFSYGDAMAVV